MTKCAACSWNLRYFYLYTFDACEKTITANWARFWTQCIRVEFMKADFIIEL